MLRGKMGNLPRSGQANTVGAWTMLLAMVEGLAVLGQRDEATKLYPLILEAIAMYRRIGMPKHVEMAEARLAEARPRP
jgi:hypothetical protein